MGKYEFRSKVRYSECGENSRLSMGGLVNYFQDTPTFQGEDLGIGVGYLKKQGIAWILSSWQIVTDHMPKLAEDITVKTWAYDFKGFYGLRNLTLEDGSGHMAAWANSVWVLMDMKSARPVKVPEHLIERYGLAEKLDMDYAPRKIALPEGGQEMPPFPVHQSHLDTNHHVNNGQYIQMALDYLPAGFEIRETRVEYRAQAFLGDMIYPVVHNTTPEMVTVSLRKEDKSPYAVLQFRAQNSSRK